MAREMDFLKQSREDFTDNSGEKDKLSVIQLEPIKLVKNLDLLKSENQMTSKNLNKNEMNKLTPRDSQTKNSTSPHDLSRIAELSGENSHNSTML